jgi:hypothetical protein
MQAENTRLKARIKRLEKLVRLASKVIKRQRNQLDSILFYAHDILRKGHGETSRHLPRGTWALWKGRLEVAHRVYKMAWINLADDAFFQMLASIRGL